MKRGYMALSGDPVTNGHLWVIEKGIALFDELTVALAVNPSKKYRFDFADRVTMLVEALAERGMSFRVAFTSISPDKFTVKEAKNCKADFLLRGVRNAQDFEYEMSLARMNRKLEPSVETILLPTPIEYMDLSSSFVISLVGLENWEEIVSQYVPKSVLNGLLRLHNERNMK